jgi:hypothetical protein
MCIGDDKRGVSEHNGPPTHLNISVPSTATLVLLPEELSYQSNKRLTSK